MYFYFFVSLILEDFQIYFIRYLEIMILWSLRINAVKNNVNCNMIKIEIKFIFDLRDHCYLIISFQFYRLRLK